MVHIRGLLRGRKFNSRHSTVITGADNFIVRARVHPCVSKITLGPIEPCRSGSRHCKMVVHAHAIKVTYRGTTAVQTFWIYGKDLNRIVADLKSQ